MTMGCFDNAEVCELVGTYALSNSPVLALFFALFALFGKVRFFRPLLRFLVNIALFEHF